MRHIFEGQGISSFANWAERHGGVIVGPEVRVILRAHNSTPVIIDDITVQITSQEPTKSGWFNAWSGCGGAVNVRSISVNLDRNPLAVTWRGKSGYRIRPLTLKVTDTDNEVIDVQVYTSQPKIVHWVIQVFYSAPAGAGVIRVDNHGTPFIATSLRGSAAYTVNYRTGRFMRTVSRDNGKYSDNSKPDYRQTC